MTNPLPVHTYNPADCAVFQKTKEQYGGLSNMAAGFPLLVNGTVFRTSEALYQCFRFPHRADIQKAIVAEKSPMAAKMVAKKSYPLSRPDWMEVRAEVMYWCLRVKLLQNYDAFAELLRSTGERSIVEHSRHDDWWGAVAQPDGTLKGCNSLGVLLMALRAVYTDPALRAPLSAPNLPGDIEPLLFGRAIETVTAT